MYVGLHSHLLRIVSYRINDDSSFSLLVGESTHYYDRDPKHGLSDGIVFVSMAMESGSQWKYLIRTQTIANQEFKSI